ncbi:Hypothetical protein DHA2_151666, partial [Giardia duodenalis]
VPLSWSHSTRSWMPVDSSHAVVSGKRPTSLLMDCGALLQAASHPARDHVDAHPVQCVWLSDVWAPSICTTRLGMMLRSTEASSKASEAIRTGSSLSRLALQPASIYSRVSRHCQLLWQTPGRWPRPPPLSGAGRISPLLSARHPEDPDLPVEGFTEIAW